VPKAQPSVLGISFDGLAISGIVSEFLNLANILRRHDLRILLDLGYDITGYPRDPLQEERLPSWAHLTSCLPRGSPDASLLNQFNQEACRKVACGQPISSCPEYHRLCSNLASQLFVTFQFYNVRLLFVDNGTLPYSHIFTESLYQAIVAYGYLNRLGKYVLWRDYDLMWSAEPHLYGEYPYPGVRKPLPSQYIHYAVLSSGMKRKMEDWAPGVEYHVIPNRFFLDDLKRHDKISRLRDAFGVPRDACLIARCTRVIPQKCIERDIRLLHQIQRHLNASDGGRKVFLFVTGPKNEDVGEFAHLNALAKSLLIADQVIWGDGLLPFNPLLGIPRGEDRFSVADLLSESDLSSFLTSYDYEGFGNPPGEAMAMSVPYIATTYEFYKEIYGRRGAIAPLLRIGPGSLPGDPMPDSFVASVLQLLSDPLHRNRVTRHNLRICQTFFSMRDLHRQILGLFSL
jgi:glycosyltransferase involved in cell wall biosynthesis